MDLSRLVLASFLVALTPILAGEMQKQADNHHEEMQSPHEGVLFGRLENGEIEYGFAGLLGEDRPPVSEHTLFEIGSITKVFTGILLADQVLRGNVMLEDSIVDILTDEVEGDFFSLQPVTLRSLATHTSGLPRLPGNMETGADPNDPYAHYSNEKLYEYLRAFTAEDFEEPGTMSYSNLGMGLLGHLLELASGQSYEELLSEVILEPLEMTTTFYQRSPESVPEPLADQFATGHNAGKPVSHWRIDSLGGAGAIVSSASELFKFAEAHWAPDTTLPLRQAMGLASKVHEGSMGLGWFVKNGVLSHDGGTGGFVSSLKVNVEKELAIIRLENTSAPSVIESIEGDFTSIAGFWTGVIETPSGELPQVIYIRDDGHCRLYSLEQSIFGLPAALAKFSGDEFVCRFPSIGGSFTATLTEGNLDGEWQQSSSFPLTLAPSEKIPSKLKKNLTSQMTGDFTDLYGYWSGYLGGEAGLFIIIHFLPVGPAVDVSLFSPDQTNASLPVSSAAFDGETLQFKSKPLNAVFSATLKEKQLKGIWNQGVPLPLHLEWSEQRPARE